MKNLEYLQKMSDEERIKEIQKIRDYLHSLYPVNMPIDNVKWVSIDEVEANDYNPNKVAKEEMGLLYKSIDKDGYTQPVVTIYDPDKKKYIIVDGFHRYYVCKHKENIRERTRGLLPIVVIKKDINDRMASTIRHNRARGEHSITGMANMVFKMLDGGWADEDICNEIGLEPTELIRLKHITGFSKLYENIEYSKAWKTQNQLKYEREWQD
jgi:ParB-like chromosome segregation protein Spo0J